MLAITASEHGLQTTI